MVSSANKLLPGQQATPANIIVSGNPPNIKSVLPTGGGNQIMDPIVIAPDSFVINQQNIVVSKAN